MSERRVVRLLVPLIVVAYGGLLIAAFALALGHWLAALAVESWAHAAWAMACTGSFIAARQTVFWFMDVVDADEPSSP